MKQTINSAFSSYWAETDFNIESCGNLELDHSDPKKAIGVNYPSGPTYLHVGESGQIVLRILSWNVFEQKPFYIEGQCDLDLSPSDPKNNTGHLPFRTNAPIKFGEPKSNNSFDKEWKLFLIQGHRLWHNDSKKGVIYSGPPRYPRPPPHQNLLKLGQTIP